MNMNFKILFLIIILFSSHRVYKVNSIEKHPNFVYNVYGEAITIKKIPVEFYLHSSVSKAESEAIFSAISDIENSVGKKIFVFKGISRNEKSKDNKNILYSSKNWSHRSPSEQAYTSAHWSADEISEFDIEFNANLPFDYNNQTVSPTSYHFKSLVIHELLHGFGIAHSESVESVMNPYLPMAVVRTSFSIEDINSLMFIFSEKTKNNIASYQAGSK